MRAWNRYTAKSLLRRGWWKDAATQRTFVCTGCAKGWGAGGRRGKPDKRWTCANKRRNYRARLVATDGKSHNGGVGIWSD